ncbi:NmrA family NAD(P)-binding protein [Mycolicibacterium murale]|nr:NmrA family NAD(P)-binding protein [Mycolicibacterium murale]MCV7185940.1 NmrA family NAD(P)-binding protein [Mycolicibacterium murale]
MSSQNGVTLVFGATGRAAGTAATVVRLLGDAGHDVRALVRRDDERAQWLRDQGAEVVFGDFADRRTLVPALDDVTAVQFTHPVSAGVIPAAANLVSAIREVGNDPHVVVCSMGTAIESDSPSGYARAQYVADELITTSLRSAVALKFAAHFYEMINVFYGETIRRTGGFASYHGDAPIQWMAGLDAAEICVRALLNPQLFGDERTPLIPSAVLMSNGEIADLISTATSRSISYRSLSESEWNEQLTELGEAADATTVQHLAATTKMWRENGDRFRSLARTDTERLVDLLGRPPVNFADFIREHHDDFQGQPSTLGAPA